MSPLRALLLDRDGTVIEERHYLSDPDGAALIAGAGEALAGLRRQGVRLFIVSNQSGIGRGYFPADACGAVNARVEALLAAHGASVAASVFCPHAPEAGCACRKPATGLWEALAAAHGLAAKTTAMAGDNASDVAFGRACGLARVVLTLTGHGRQYAAKLHLPMPETGWTELANPGPNEPHAVAADLPAAVDYLRQAMAETVPAPCKPDRNA
ncbi:MAG: HAD-IIIA family hydrolase [Desulfovibrionaceae bacterium]|nr:HAD-IIIA family hydrolase [Desulfovibrionaceae bacterium]MBF0514620.1 HAD-IIIA family hydrolase [Desulfovibrionaceae bacterium]